MKIIWQDPDVMQNGHHKFDDFFAALRVRPGKWARWPAPYRSGNRTWRMKQRHPEFEFTSRTLEDGKVYMFARFVGNGPRKGDAK